MAFVGLKVDDSTKAIWVEEAERNDMSLSAWLKAAANRYLDETGAPPTLTLIGGTDAASKIAEARQLLNESREDTTS
jgi:hypothetical protein